MHTDQQGLRRLPHADRSDRLRLREVRRHRHAPRKAQAAVLSPTCTRRRSPKQRGRAGARYHGSGRRASRIREFTSPRQLGEILAGLDAVPGVHGQAGFPLHVRPAGDSGGRARASARRWRISQSRIPLQGNAGFLGKIRREFSRRKELQCRTSLRGALGFRAGFFLKGLTATQAPGRSRACRRWFRCSTRPGRRMRPRRQRTQPRRSTSGSCSGSTATAFPSATGFPATTGPNYDMTPCLTPLAPAARRRPRPQRARQLGRL